MSHATAFIDRVQTDAELRQQAQHAGIDALVRLAAEHGYTFTADEYLEAAKIYAEEHSLDTMELSDKDLSTIAGGPDGHVDSISF